MMKRCIWLGYRGVISCGTGWAVEVLLYSVSRGPLPQRATTSRRIAVGDHMALQTASQALRGAATGWFTVVYTAAATLRGRRSGVWRCEQSAAVTGDD